MLTRDLVNAKKQMSEKDEELKELKSERNNTRVSEYIYANCINMHVI